MLPVTYYLQTDITRYIFLFRNVCRRFPNSRIFNTSIFCSDSLVGGETERSSTRGHLVALGRLLHGHGHGLHQGRVPAPQHHKF